MRASVAALLLALASCSSRSDEAAGLSPAAKAAATVDVPPHATEPATTVPGADPGGTPAAAAPGGLHLDDSTVEYEVNRPADGRKSKPIELLLRSSPPGAGAAVDGVSIGPTPSLWRGDADGRPREFTFVMPGYATARYRFVPIRDGVVHGTLDRLKLADADAGP